MKLIRAIIQPHRLEEVRTALLENGVTGMTVSNVEGFGRQKGHKEMYRGAEYQVYFVPKVMIDLITTDARTDEICKILMDAARSGKIGDGKVIIMDIGKAYRIRTGEADDDAI